MEFFAAFVGVFEHVKRGGGGGHDDGGGSDVFGFAGGGGNSGGESASNSEAMIWAGVSQSMTGFTDEDNLFNLGGGEGLE